MKIYRSAYGGVITFSQISYNIIVGFGVVEKHPGASNYSVVNDVLVPAGLIFHVSLYPGRILLTLDASDSVSVPFKSTSILK